MGQVFEEVDRGGAQAATEQAIPMLRRRLEMGSWRRSAIRVANHGPAGRPRNEGIGESQVGVYYAWMRCVRRTFLRPNDAWLAFLDLNNSAVVVTATKLPRTSKCLGSIGPPKQRNDAAC